MERKGCTLFSLLENDGAAGESLSDNNNNSNKPRFDSSFFLSKEREGVCVCACVRVGAGCKTHIKNHHL